MSREQHVASGVPSRLPLDVQLRRYHRSFRRRLRKFARTSDRLKDLVYTFPAAAVAVAVLHVEHRAQTAAVLGGISAFVEGDVFYGVGIKGREKSEGVRWIV